MSFQTFVTEKLAAITSTLNAISTNAKKIDELPVQDELDVLSKLHVSRDGISESLQIKKLFDAITDGLKDELISIGEIVLVGNDVTIPANAQWKINKIYYQNVSEIEINIPFSEIGFIRKDILVADTNSTIYLIKGVESAGIAIRPNIPQDTVLVTEINVTDNSIDISEPIINGLYISKAEKNPISLLSTGSVSTLNVDGNNSSIVLDGSVSSLGSLDIVSFDNNYQGQVWTLKNNQSVDLILSHNSGTGNLKFNFPNETDFTLKPNETIQFSLNAGVLDYIGIIYEENVNYFKGVYLTLSALNLAHPTASAGDYAQVNEVGSTSVINYNWDAEDGIWVLGGSGGSGASNTDALPEGTSNFYFTTARVLATLLTGISFATGGAIVSTDSILIAFGKIQKNINDITTAVNSKQGYAIARTGSTITFDTPAIYNSPSSPSTSNLLDDLTGARIGIIQPIYINKAVEPTYPIGWVKIGTGTFTPSVLNMICCEWVGGTRVNYWITKA